MKRIILSGSILALSVLLSACGNVKSTKVDINSIYGHYTASYNAETGKNEYFVTFFSDGFESVELVSPSKLEVNGRELFKNTNVIIKYVYSEPAEYEEVPAVFLWTREDLTTYENSIAPVKPVSIALPARDVVHSRTQPLRISVEAEDLLPGEFFEAELVGPRGTLTSRKVFSGKEIVFENLTNIRVGDATLKLRRARVEVPQNGHPNLGGRIESEYIAKHVPVLIVE